MECFKILVDFNGIIIFDPARLRDYYGRIETGHDLWADFTSTEMGDGVIQQGIVVPLLGINDGLYEVCVRRIDERSCWDVDFAKSNRGFPLRIRERVVIADMAILLDWHENEGWIDLEVEPGSYVVDIFGYRKIAGGAVQSCGYDFVFKEVNRLPRMSAQLDKDMQVLTLDDLR